ncbi:helix-turn-helix transcriptional regulator [Actinoplanes sichuanensis]|uniref:Helix-turn-helix domain-containing protein n=1 Tax=Actinoplanes sichuanensis TaxID=512349 RepID=A0ABW4A3L8_9ACTN|nr:helix-turn-helix transcriptional regulator [Actinoplanes sichuanensis]BEL05520.1 helix-turn-helix transcriptional regulator [Actinoplanes sichuanensis]
MPGDPGPMVRRRQLSALLRQYRLAAGMSVKEVAEQMYEASSKITRIEKGQRLATVRDIVDLCRIYGLPAETRDHLTELAKGSRERQWWQRPDINLPTQTYIGMERAATSIFSYQLAVFPGLLQTPDYADAVLLTWFPDPDKRRELVAARMRRQAILQRPDPPELQVVLDEAVIRRMVGGPQVFHDQLAHVIDQALTGGCDLRIVPFSAGSHQGIKNSFTVLQFGDITSPAGDALLSGIVWLELSDGEKALDEGDDVTFHMSQFAKIRAQALTSEESLTLLRTTAAGV